MGRSGRLALKPSQLSAGDGGCPLLYIVAFVFGLRRDIRMDGQSYLQFVMPGIIAMTAMNSSFNGAGTRLGHRSDPLEELR